MASQQFAVGALISLSIAIFTVISTIYSAIVTTDKTNNNNNINRDIIKLRNNLSLNFHNVHFDNFDDYRLILHNLSKVDNENEKNMDIFLSILAYREGNILHNDSMDQYLKKYVNDTSIEPTNIIWYPLRQFLIEKEFIERYQESQNYLEISNNKITKEEDFYCNEIKDNSIIDNLKNNNNLKDTSYCSIEEIKKIKEYSQNYPYVINIMNDHYEDIPISDLTHNFKLITDYFQWFIIFSLVTGPIVFFMWIRKLY